jgi:hypothetical protein
MKHRLPTASRPRREGPTTGRKTKAAGTHRIVALIFKHETSYVSTIVLKGPMRRIIVILAALRRVGANTTPNDGTQL